LPVLDQSKIRGISFKPAAKLLFWIFVANFITLMILGAKHVETPYIELGQICTFLYFAWFILLIPVVSTTENIITDIHSPHKGSLDTAASVSASKPLYSTFGWGAN
jgi:ubiquinol-cytochrome c reductase cytochrome b subunit